MGYFLFCYNIAYRYSDIVGLRLTTIYVKGNKKCIHTKYELWDTYVNAYCSAVLS